MAVPVILDWIPTVTYLANEETDFDFYCDSDIIGEINL